MNTDTTNNTSEKRPRLVVLDAMRGIALFGIALANYPEFSLYSFLTDVETEAMPTRDADCITRWWQLLFVDGKFYTIFSILFGIGFSIIIANAKRRGADGMRIFYRRMAGLVAIGLMHLMLLWSGDILLLYALMGMLLPWFYGMSDRKVLAWAGCLLVLPVACDAMIAITGVHPEAVPYDAWWYWCGRFGITEENFATWLRDADGYGAVSQFLVQGAFERMWEFVGSHRYFKVLGLFLIGMHIGRKGIHKNIEQHLPLLRKVAKAGFGVSLPLSVAYAWSGMNGHPMGDVAHSVFYLVSVYPLGIAYMSATALLWHRSRRLALWQILASPGRMSLTTYLTQSVIGMFLFYGIGFGLGCSFGLLETEFIAAGIFLVQTLCANLWLRAFDYGPFEWVWRMFTYGRFMG